jgi:hypothetical protein
VYALARACWWATRGERPRPVRPAPRPAWPTRAVRPERAAQTARTARTAPTEWLIRAARTARPAWDARTARTARRRMGVARLASAWMRTDRLAPALASGVERERTAGGRRRCVGRPLGARPGSGGMGRPRRSGHRPGATRLPRARLAGDRMCQVGRLRLPLRPAAAAASVGPADSRSTPGRMRTGFDRRPGRAWPRSGRRRTRRIVRASVDRVTGTASRGSRGRSRCGQPTHTASREASRRKEKASRRGPNVAERAPKVAVPR